MISTEASFDKTNCSSMALLLTADLHDLVEEAERITSRYRGLSDSYTEYREYWEPTMMAVGKDRDVEDKILKREAQRVSEKLYYCVKHAEEIEDDLLRIMEEFVEMTQKFISNIEKMDDYNEQMWEVLKKMEALEPTS